MANYNTESTYPSLSFEYPKLDDPRLAELRSLAIIELDDRMGELSNISTVIGFAHGLFTHDGKNNPSANDAVTILKEARAGQSFRCVEYSLLAVGLLWANGITARTIGLKTVDVETREYGAGHVVIEFWSKDFNKWVMSDVQAGIIPRSGDIPLSALELGQVIDRDAALDFTPVVNSRFDANQAYSEALSYADWIKEYLYFIDTPKHLTLAHKNMAAEQIVMLVPLGVTNPKSFQSMFDMNAIYTNNVPDFYSIVQ